MTLNNIFTAYFSAIHFFLFYCKNLLLTWNVNIKILNIKNKFKSLFCDIEAIMCTHTVYK